MLTNLVLFLACAPMWLLIGIGLAASVLMPLPLRQAKLPARVRASRN